MITCTPFRIAWNKETPHYNNNEKNNNLLRQSLKIRTTDIAVFVGSSKFEVPTTCTPLLFWLSYLRNEKGKNA